MPTFSDPNHVPVTEIIGRRPEEAEPGTGDSIKQILLDIRRLLMEGDERRRERPKIATPALTRGDVIEIVRYELTKIPVPSVPYPSYPYTPPVSPVSPSFPHIWVTHGTDTAGK